MPAMESERLAGRLEARASAGLRDVRFDIRHDERLSSEAVCAEVNALYDAVERGDLEPLDFGDALARR